MGLTSLESTDEFLALGDQRINHIGDLQQSPTHVRFISEALVQAPLVLYRPFSWQFIVHELL